MARILVKVSHPIAGGSLGHLTAIASDARIVLAKLSFNEVAAEKMPEGSGRVLHSTVKRHVRQFLKDTRYCFTNDPESGFECEMRVL